MNPLWLFLIIPGTALVTWFIFACCRVSGDCRWCEECMYRKWYYDNIDKDA